MKLIPNFLSMCENTFDELVQWRGTMIYKGKWPVVVRLQLSSLLLCSNFRTRDLVAAIQALWPHRKFIQTCWQTIAKVHLLFHVNKCHVFCLRKGKKNLSGQ